MQVTAVIGILLIVETVITTADANSCNCERTGNGSGRFLVCRHLRKNATDARSYCASHCNSTLASIQSREEWQELSLFIGKVQGCTKIGGKSTKAFYIGAEDSSTEGEWRWIDDNSLLNETYSNWYMPSLTRPNGSKCRDQPDQQNICVGDDPVEQDYAVMQMCEKTLVYGTWFDVIGNISRSFICKISNSANTRRDLTTQTIDERATSATESSIFETTAMTTPPSQLDIESTTTDQHVSTPAESPTVKNDLTSATKPKEPAPLPTTSERYSTLQIARVNMDAFIGKKDDDHLRQLQCMMLSILKPLPEVESLIEENECEKVNRDDDWNPILHFEEYVSRKAAEIYFRKNLTTSFSKHIGGLRLDIVPKAAKEKSIESFEMPMENSCDECDKLQIEHSNMDRFDKVIVAARFDRSVLEGLNVYDSPLESTVADGQSVPEYTAYVSPRTSVLSVTLFKNTKTKGVHPVSMPTTINFNLQNDDSLSEIVVNGTRSRLSKLKRKCVFMKSNGKWSDRGCIASVDKATKSLQCNCNHTTAFAVMVSLNAIEIPGWLETVLIIVEIIGIVFLALTLAMLLFVKKTVKKGRIITQLHLCLALLLMHISMVSASYAKSIEGLCVALAALSHFLMISSAMWMLNEGIVLYKKTGSGALNFDIHKFKKWLIILGWLLPFIYAVVCLVVGMALGVYLDTTVEFDDLKGRNLLHNTSTPVKKYQMCWLGVKNYMVVAAIVPVAITLLLATCILAWVTKVIWGMSKQALDMMPSGVKKNREYVQATARAVALLIPVLGLPWILAFMVNVNGAEVTFTAINGITNGLQGLILFIIYIIINRETRTSMKRKLTRSFSTTNGHSLSAIPSGTARKSETRNMDNNANGISNIQESPNKNAYASPKV